MSDAPEPIRRKHLSHSEAVREDVRRMWVDERRSYTEIGDFLGVSRVGANSPWQR